MTDRQTRQSRKRRRQEMIEQATHDREVKGAGQELSGPQGVGAPRVTESDIPATHPAGTRKLPLPD